MLLKFKLITPYSCSFRNILVTFHIVADERNAINLVNKVSYLFMNELKALDEIVSFIALQSPEKVLVFKASEPTKTRVYDLVYKEKTDALTKKEKSELEYYKVLEHIMRLAKAKAYAILHT